MKGVNTTMMSTVAVLILLLAVALPVIGLMSENTGEPVYSQNDGDRMAKATSLASPITLAKTADGVTVNGSASTSYTIVSSSIAINVGTTAVSWIHTNGADAATTGNLNWSEGDVLTFTGTTWTLTPAEGSSITAVSGSFSWIYYPDASGTFVKSTGPVYIDSNKEFVTVGFLSTTKMMVTTGTVSGLTALYGNASQLGNTIFINSEKTDYTNTVTSVMAGNATVGQTMIVPVDYTSDMEQGILSNIVGLIPVILVVALLVGIVYHALLRREE